MSVPQFKSVGRCTKTHGFDGGVLVSFDERYPESVTEEEAYFFEIDGSKVPLMVESKGVLSGQVYFHFKRITNKEEAQNLVGSEVLIESDRVPEVSDEGHAQVIGWNLHDKTSGRRLVIVGEEEYPEQLMWIVRDEEGTETLIPVVDEWIKEINEDDQELSLECPEGLL